jgi:phosphoserine aminotransferase
MGGFFCCFFVFFFFSPFSLLTHFFSAGPASLPLAPMQVAQKEFLDYHGNGASIFEMSHRDHGGPVQQMIQDATTRLKLGLFPAFSFLLFFKVSLGRC